jgi:hypothetical protein
MINSYKNYILISLLKSRLKGVFINTLILLSNLIAVSQQKRRVSFNNHVIGIKGLFTK